MAGAFAWARVWAALKLGCFVMGVVDFVSVVLGAYAARWVSLRVGGAVGKLVQERMRGEPA